MGCKFGNDQKEEEQNEIKKSVIHILKDRDEKDKGPENFVPDLEYYQKQLEDEQNGKIDKPQSIIQDYNNEAFRIINTIRQKPNIYANFIEDCMDNIIETEENKKKKIVYKKQLKVELKRGEPAFREAVKELKSIDPLPALISKNELMVPLPTSEYELNDKNYLKNKIKYIRASRKVDAFFKDMVKNPEVSILLLVSDAYGDGGERRKIILNKDIKFVGINSGMVGNSFVAYFAFSS